MEMKRTKITAMNETIKVNANGKKKQNIDKMKKMIK